VDTVLPPIDERGIPSAAAIVVHCHKPFNLQRVAHFILGGSTPFRFRAGSADKAQARQVRDGEPVDFLDWAERYINAMHPLHEAPRVEEFEGEEYSWRADDEAKAEFSRLSGHGWAHSWKVSKGAATQCDTDEDEFA
jgi:hypothetical protein